MDTFVVYPGTFDPLTNGHTDLVRRANKLFSPVVFAIADSPQKKTLFSLQERIDLSQAVFADLQLDVQVIGFSQLLAHFLQEINASTIIRGLRAVSDFEYELQLANMNRVLASQVETVFLTPDVEYSYISSSLVREIASFGGDVSSLVHPLVVEKLKKTFA